MAATPNFTFRPTVKDAIQELNPSYSNPLIEIGQSAFVTTGLTVEVETNLTKTPVAVFALGIDPTTDVAAGDDILFSDGVITSGAVTVARTDDGTSGMKFWYMFCSTHEA